MDVKGTIQKLSAQAKTLIKKIASVRKLPYFKRYAVLAVVLTLLFTALSFPFEVIVEQQLNKAEGKAFRSAAIGFMDLNLIGESYLENADITLKDNSSVSAKSLTANMSLIGLLSGNIKGDVMAEKLAYTNAKGSVRAEGNININADITMDSSSSMPTDGSVRAIADSLRIFSENLELPGGLGFTIPSPVSISSVNMELAVAKSLMAIKRLDVAGKDIRGKVSGSVALAPIFGNSKLNLKVAIDLDSGVLAEYKPLLEQFAEAGKLIVNITGTAARPHTELPRRSAGAQVMSAVQGFKTSQTDEDAQAYGDARQQNNIPVNRVNIKASNRF